MVSSKISSLMGLFLIRSTAGPERMACVAQAMMLAAPPFFLQRDRSVAQRAGGVNHVVDQDNMLVLHIADNVHYLRDICTLPSLVDNGKRAAETGGKIPGPCDGAEVGETTT